MHYINPLEYDLKLTFWKRKIKDGLKGAILAGIKILFEMKYDILSNVIANPDFSVVSTVYRDEAINSNNFEIALSVS